MPINPIIDTSNSPRLNETFLTLDQRRKLSQKLQNISPDLTRFNVAGSYDPSKIRVNVEICYGKFDTLNQTFEYEEDRGGSGEIRMETYRFSTEGRLLLLQTRNFQPTELAENRGREFIRRG